MSQTMRSTTLSAAVTAQTQQIPLASVTYAIAPGPPTFPYTVLFVDREAMAVLAVNGSVATVQRGIMGTTATAHSSGQTVWVGPANAYGASDPSGQFPSGDDIYLPRVVISTGNVWNDDGGGNWAIVSSGGGGVVGPSGSGSLNFGSIADGSIEELTFTLTGAVVGDRLVPGWPSGLDTGLVGSMIVTSADTVTVRLANLSGAAINPAALTFSAQIVR